MVEMFTNTVFIHIISKFAIQIIIQVPELPIKPNHTDLLIYPSLQGLDHSKPASKLTLYCR